ncbi:hypothetical protein FLAT13_00052 [Flavobacterium salmonis]|uniref:Uncharacterized protein n=1 Tax=Flavobacterium salmonis TaxID=2654844 RepID=A0A6V6YM20_9FLAO|nr:hypothetical protein FLAT13_00052 [Flavobacterium salmonis]
MPETVTFTGLAVAVGPDVVKLKGYVPSGRFVDVKAMLPLPPQVAGLVAAPAVSVGLAGSEMVLAVAVEPVHPELVIEKSL